MKIHTDSIYSGSELRHSESMEWNDDNSRDANREEVIVESFLGMSGALERSFWGNRVITIQ
jgi:hypothetical protein